MGHGGIWCGRTAIKLTTKNTKNTKNFDTENTELQRLTKVIGD